MYKAEPAYSHGLIPEQIVNPQVLDLLTEHYSFSLTLTTENYQSKMGRKYTREELALCAEMYEMLRQNGFYPMGVSSVGTIQWGVGVKSKVQMVMEKYMPELPDKPTKAQVEQMKNQCRCKFGEIGV